VRPKGNTSKYGDKAGQSHQDKYDKGATFWTSMQAVQYARGAGFAVHEAPDRPTYAERSDMPGVGFVLEKNQQRRFVWVRES
jgi:hypothetical protein